MKNKDKILRYLSDLMEDSERIQFEERLKSDPKLKDEFDKIQNNLHKLNLTSRAEEDLNYFNNLVPKVRDKIENRKRRKKIAIIPAISIALSIFILFILQFPKSTEQNLFNINLSSEELSAIITDSDSLTVDELLQTNFVEDYAYYNAAKTSDMLSINLDESFISGVNLNDIDSYYNTEEISEYDELSSAQVDLVYEELLNKKIL